jgi:hypothetical protein
MESEDEVQSGVQEVADSRESGNMAVANSVE